MTWCPFNQRYGHVGDDVVTETLLDEPFNPFVFPERSIGMILSHHPMVVDGDIPPQEMAQLEPVVGRMHVDADDM